MMPHFDPEWLKSQEEIDAQHQAALDDQSMLFTGVDFGTDGANAEVIARRNSDGTITVLEINQWKHDIDLEVER